jgi:hypothetical protein
MIMFISSLGQQVEQVIEGIRTLYYNSGGTISEFKPIDSIFTWGVGKNPVDGQYYFCAMSTGGPPLNRSHYVFKYNMASNAITQQVHVPKSAGITSSQDTHPIPIITFDSAGRTYLVVEKAANSTGWSDGHNTDILIYRTGTAGDLSTMALWKTLAGKYSYPRLWINGSSYYMAARNTRAAADTTKQSIEISSDGGVTWAAHQYIDTGGAGKRAYARNIFSYQGEMIVCINIRNDNNAAFESISVVKSTDGIHWSNWQGSFSKDTKVFGAITLAEMEANYMLWTVNSSTNQLTFEGGRASGGSIKVLGARSSKTGVVVDGNSQTQYQEMRLYTYSSGAWTYKDVSALIPSGYTHFWAYERILHYVNTPDADFIYVLDRRNTADCRLYEYKSLNGFDTWQQREVWQGSGNYYFGSATHNAQNQDEHLVILVDTQGIYDDFSSSSNLLIINP